MGNDCSLKRVFSPYPWKNYGWRYANSCCIVAFYNWGGSTAPTWGETGQKIAPDRFRATVSSSVVEGTKTCYLFGKISYYYSASKWEKFVSLIVWVGLHCRQDCRKQISLDHRIRKTFIQQVQDTTTGSVAWIARFVGKITYPQLACWCRSVKFSGC